MAKLTEKIGREKPWAILGITRQQYTKAKPWKRTPLSRADFEDMVRALPLEVVRDLKDYADAERLAAAIFGEQGVE